MMVSVKKFMFSEMVYDLKMKPHTLPSVQPETDWTQVCSSPSYCEVEKSSKTWIG